MIFKKELVVADHQRVLVFKNQKFDSIIAAGKHKFWNIGNAYSFINFDLNDIYFTDKNAIRLFNKHSELNEHILHWKLAESEVGLLYFNDMLRGIVAPGEHLYVWKDAGDFRLDTKIINENIELEEATLQLINRARANDSTNLIISNTAAAVKPIADITVDKQHVGLLYVNGKLTKLLEPGQHGFWQFNKHVEVKTFDQRSQLIEVSGQEILSKDRVSLRINLSANIRVTDAQLASSSVDKVGDYVYKSLQLALREAVGTKTLDDILIDKLYVNETVKELVVTKLEAVGVSLESVGMKDIVLPGEMKAILNQVVEAQKAAEANVIKRREETSSTRALHNTAKVMENNPILMRLKELEALEKVAEKIDSLTVHNGLEGLMKGVVNIGST
jgi:regulator of protease activity HflC (stomatin/prohibitin superfamily)